MKGDAVLRVVAGLEKLVGLKTAGPVTIRAGLNDAKAAALILNLEAQYPDLTYGDVQDILLDALWWIGYLASTNELPVDPTEEE